MRIVQREQVDLRRYSDTDYFASANGDVFKNGDTSKAMKPYMRPRDGRLYVGIWRGQGRRTTRGVHQIVAEAFLGERPLGMEVNHKNGNRLDNRAANLEYVTPRENKRHAWDTGLHPPPPPMFGEANRKAKLNEESVRLMRADKRAGLSLKRLAHKYGVCKSTVDYVTRRVYWGHVA